jgi:hypothetical protein
VIDTDPAQVEFFLLELGKGVDRPMGFLAVVVGLGVDIDSDFDAVHPASLEIWRILHPNPLVTFISSTFHSRQRTYSFFTPH